MAVPTVSRAQGRVVQPQSGVAAPGLGGGGDPVARLEEIRSQCDRLKALVTVRIRTWEEVEKLEDLLEDDPKNQALHDRRKAGLEAVRTSERDIDTQEGLLLKFCNESIHQSSTLKHLPFKFSRASGLKIGDLPFARDMCISKLDNVLGFLEGVLITLQKETSNIFREFGFNSEHLDTIQVKLTILGEETHNKGQSAVLVSFVHEGKEVGKVVYKPRSSLTEKAVLNLFDQLNRFPGRSVLPVYKILSSEDRSYWEYVEGKMLVTDPASFLMGVIDGDKRKEGEKNLAFINAVCRYIGVTDLHHENVILREDSMQWVPIDMEVIKRGSPTGLYGHGKEEGAISFSQAEIALMDRFNESQFGRPSRNVPIPTAALVRLIHDLNSSADIELTCLQIIERLSSHFNIIISKLELIALLNNDFSNGDIPTFTQLDNFLYFGNLVCKIGELK